MTPEAEAVALKDRWTRSDEGRLSERSKPLCEELQRSVLDSLACGIAIHLADNLEWSRWLFRLVRSAGVWINCFVLFANTSAEGSFHARFPPAEGCSGCVRRPEGPSLRMS